MIIEVQEVRKYFKEVKAVDGVSLQVDRGEFLAVLGPNGAGKTTLVEMIEGLQKPDGGTILVDGKSWDKHRNALHHLIGISLQETRYIDKLTVFETLRLFGSFYGLGKERAEEVLHLTGLDEKRKAFTVNISGGQRQRLALAIALLNKPEILILDEPTTGLDPVARRDIWNILRDLQKERKTSLILTTHYMEEAEKLCDRIIILDNGKILVQGTLDELLKRCTEGKKTLDDLFVQLTGRSLMNEDVAK